MDAVWDFLGGGLPYLYALVLVLLSAVWLFLVLLNLPGTWLMLISVGVVAYLSPEMFWVWSLVALVVLAIIGEVLEFFGAAAGSTKAGSSKRGLAGAILGAILGGIAGTMIPVPVIGTLVGSCVGAGIGAGGGELWAGRTMENSLLVGRGAAVGRFWGTVAKLGVGLVMWVWIAVDAFIGW